MNITTYENTVKKGTIKAHGRSDGLREMLEQLSEMQKIVTAPMSVDTPEQDGDKAPETAAADQVVGRAKSTAGAVRDAVTSEIKRAVRKSKNKPVERGVRIEAPPKQCHMRHAPVRKLHSRQLRRPLWRL